MEKNLYYIPPDEKCFVEVKEKSIEIWQTYDNDFGYVDEEGYIYISGRKEDILKKENGEIIFKRFIEEIVHQCSGVLEVYVFCDNSDDIICYVSLKKGFVVKIKDLINFCKLKLDGSLVPKKFVIGKIPKRANGKINREKIETGYLGK